MIQPGPPKIRQLATLREVSTAFRIDEAEIRRYVRIGAIPYLRIRGSLRFDVAEINAWLNSRKFRSDMQERLEQIEMRGVKPTAEKQDNGL